MQLLTAPLIISSLVSGAGSLDTRAVGWVGTSAFTYYLGTTMLAVAEGLVFMLALRPGSNETTMVNSTDMVASFNETGVDLMLDVIR